MEDEYIRIKIQLRKLKFKLTRVLVILKYDFNTKDAKIHSNLQSKILMELVSSIKRLANSRA